jgi:hydrogenase maturation protein HypF
VARILACGAFLKNAACILDTDAADKPLWSGVHGDLSSPDACRGLEQSVQILLNRVGGRVDAVAHDLHPDFFSTHLARRVAQEMDVEAIAVQHHHAHIASVNAEHGLDCPVIGLALDGVGLGSDGAIWGGEILRVVGHEFERVGHLWPLALPGGDVAAREPWRMAASALHACGLAAQIVPRFGPVVGDQAASTIQTMLARSLNSPPSTAAGRWFDAAAGLLGLSVRQTVEAEAAISLEQTAARWLRTHPVEVDTAHWCVTDSGQVDLRPLFVSWANQTRSMSADEVGEAAARFHLTLGEALGQQAVTLAAQHGLQDVVLGGGCFFNAILKQRLVSHLERAGLRVWSSKNISCGDAGLALGQAWVAAAQKESLCV